jgi:hypothetical protein
VAHEFQPSVWTRPEIDERCNGFAIRKQGFPVEMRKCPIGDAEAVCPDQPIVFLWCCSRTASSVAF